MTIHGNDLETELTKGESGQTTERGGFEFLKEVKPPVNLEDPAFPVTVATRDASGEVFRNQIVGGFSKRDYIAIEFAAAFLSNPAFVAKELSVDRLRQIAIHHANLFALELEAAK